MAATRLLPIEPYCMRLPLVYHDDYSPPFPAAHRFPMEKFRLLRDRGLDQCWRGQHPTPIG